MRAFLYFFSIFISVVVLCSAQDVDEFESAIHSCHKESGLPDELAGPPYFEDSKVKCFFACVMKRIGNMVDGKISLEGEMQYLEKYIPDADEELIAQMKQCVGVANQLSGECEVAAAMAKCMIGLD